MDLDEDLVGKLAYGWYYLALPSFRLVKMFTFSLFWVYLWEFFEFIFER